MVNGNMDESMEEDYVSVWDCQEQHGGLPKGQELQRHLGERQQGGSYPVLPCAGLAQGSYQERRRSTRTMEEAYPVWGYESQSRNKNKNKKETKIKNEIKNQEWDNN